MPPLHGPTPAPKPKPTSETGNGETQRYRLAVNLFDLDRVDAMIRSMMLQGKLASSPVHIVPYKLDETGVEFTCELLMAASICDILRSHDRQLGDYPTRLYIHKGKAWSKLSGSAILTLVKDGVCILNPYVFRRERTEEQIVPAEYVPPPTRCVIID
jgi:hypothetical protein